MTNQAQSATQATTLNNEVVGFDIHIMTTVDERGSYNVVRDITTTDCQEAVIGAVFNAGAGDRDYVEQQLEGLTTIAAIVGKDDLIYDDTGDISFEIAKITPLKKVDIRVEYDGELCEKTILLPIDKEENKYNAYFA